MDTNPFDPSESELPVDSASLSAEDDPTAVAVPSEAGQTDPTAVAVAGTPSPADPTAVAVAEAPSPADPTAAPNYAAPTQGTANTPHQWQPLPPGNWAPPGSAAPSTPPTWSPTYGGQQPYATGQTPPPWGQPPYGGGDTPPQPPYGAGDTPPQPPYGGGDTPPQPPYGQPQPPYGPYGQPPTGYGYGGQPPYGGGPGFGSPAGSGGPGAGAGGPGATGGTGPSGAPVSRTARKVLIGVAVVALVAAAASAGELIGRDHKSSSSNTTQTLPTVAPTGKSTSQTKLNVNAIANKVRPETVDITSILSTEDEEAEGTGMILTSDGEVLTNNHVIEDATSISAQVDGKGQKYTVKVLGTDVTGDVALVMLEGASGLPHIAVGNSSAVKVGDPVVAIGNALGLGGTPTVTSGIISALGRSITASDAGASTSEHLTGLLQTDAPINPGNSGGPLVDAAGQVIGMDTAADTGSGTQTASNIGFAIPIDRALAIADQIQKGEGSSTIAIGSRGIMGIDAETIAQAEQNAQSVLGSSVKIPVSYGAVVVQVLSGYPAARAGISDGDVIVGLNGQKITSPTALIAALKGDEPGKTISVTWVDGSGTRHTSSITLVAAPPA